MLIAKRLAFGLSVAAMTVATTVSMANAGDSGPGENHAGPGSRHGETGPGSRHGNEGPGSRHGNEGPGSRHGNEGPGSRHAQFGAGSRHGEEGPGSRHGNSGPGSRHGQYTFTVRTFVAPAGSLVFQSTGQQTVDIDANTPAAALSKLRQQFPNTAGKPSERRVSHSISSGA